MSGAGPTEVDVGEDSGPARAGAAAREFPFPTLEPDGPLIVLGATPAERAAEIVQQAHADARRIAAAAEAEGRARGEAAGLSEARERLAEVQSALHEAASGFAAAQVEIVERAEERAVELALTLAEKVVGTALAIDPTIVLDVVRGTLRRIADRDGVVVEVNPTDHGLVSAAMEEMAERLGGMRRFEVVADRRVEAGGCVIRTAEGELDGQPSVQLGKAEEILREAVRAGRGLA